MSYLSAMRAGMWLYNTFGYSVNATRYGGFEVELTKDEIVCFSSQAELIEFAQEKGMEVDGRLIIADLQPGDIINGHFIIESVRGDGHYDGHCLVDKEKGYKWIHDSQIDTVDRAEKLEFSQDGIDRINKMLENPSKPTEALINFLKAGKKAQKYDWHCPHCGAGDNSENDHYFGEGCHSIDCGWCEKEYEVVVHVSYSYSTIAQPEEVQL